MEIPQKILTICKDIKGTLDREIRTTCTNYSNPMFDKPIVKKSILRRKLNKLLEKYNIKEKDL
tara:strand:- start:2332 stop:2520 length:189 start_codon:yes stop_codon:yes gene_type:complete